MTAQTGNPLPVHWLSHESSPQYPPLHQPAGQSASTQHSWQLPSAHSFRLPQGNSGRTLHVWSPSTSQTCPIVVQW